MNSKLDSICFKFIGPLGRCIFSASKIPGLCVWKTVGVVCEGLTVSGFFFKLWTQFLFIYLFIGNEFFIFIFILYWSIVDLNIVLVSGV